MPNWCSNKVSMRFDSAEQYAEFVDRLIQKENLDEFEEQNKLFDTFVPTPQELVDDDKGGWYGWRVENWGTKWNPTIYSMTMDDELRTIVMSMDTAWAPPVEFFTKLTEIYPSLEIVLHYVEEGMGFMGTANISEGEAADWEIEIDRSVLEAAGAKFTEDGELDYEFEYDLFDYLEKAVV